MNNLDCVLKAAECPCQFWWLIASPRRPLKISVASRSPNGCGDRKPIVGAEGTVAVVFALCFTRPDNVIEAAPSATRGERRRFFPIIDKTPFWKLTVPH